MTSVGAEPPIQWRGLAWALLPPVAVLLLRAVLQAQTDEATANARAAKVNSAYKGERKFAAPTSTEQPVVVISGKHTYATQAKVILKNLASSKQITRPSPLVHERHAPLIVQRNIKVE